MFCLGCSPLQLSSVFSPLSFPSPFPSFSIYSLATHCLGFSPLIFCFSTSPHYSHLPPLLCFSPPHFLRLLLFSFPNSVSLPFPHLHAYPITFIFFSLFFLQSLLPFSQFLSSKFTHTGTGNEILSKQIEARANTSKCNMKNSRFIVPISNWKNGRLIKEEQKVGD